MKYITYCGLILQRYPIINPIINKCRYEVLSDKEMRAKYDRGEPVFDNQGGGHSRNPHGHDQFFRHFNHGGGGHRGGGQRMHFRFQ